MNSYMNSGVPRFQMSVSWHATAFAKFMILSRHTSTAWACTCPARHRALAPHWSAVRQARISGPRVNLGQRPCYCVSESQVSFQESGRPPADRPAAVRHRDGPRLVQSTDISIECSVDACLCCLLRGRRAQQLRNTRPRCHGATYDSRRGSPVFEPCHGQAAVMRLCPRNA